MNTYQRPSNRRFIREYDSGGSDFKVTAKINGQVKTFTVRDASDIEAATERFQDHYPRAKIVDVQEIHQHAMAESNRFRRRVSRRQISEYGSGGCDFKVTAKINGQVKTFTVRDASDIEAATERFQDHYPRAKIVDVQEIHQHAMAESNRYRRQIREYDNGSGCCDFKVTAKLDGQVKTFTVRDANDIEAATERFQEHYPRAKIVNVQEIHQDHTLSEMDLRLLKGISKKPIPNDDESDRNQHKPYGSRHDTFLDRMRMAAELEQSGVKRGRGRPTGTGRAIGARGASGASKLMDSRFDSTRCDDCNKRVRLCICEDYANSPNARVQSTDYMVNTLSGGLNRRKRTGQTTVPVVGTRNLGESRNRFRNYRD